ncbi:MAG: hypothetical protein K2Y12_02910 [Chitinophagaceae bacterium]|jgi:hypothetical protein|nr:hypothetical protein [Chitinophagaceae bacterium]
MKTTKLFLSTLFLVGAVTIVMASEEGGGTVTTTTCDASNESRCVITNVGEGTGKLITTTVQKID